jgi:hypothetical protein
VIAAHLANSYGPPLPGGLGGEGPLRQSARQYVLYALGLVGLLVRRGLGLPRALLRGPRGQVGVNHALYAEVYCPVVGRARQQLIPGPFGLL